MRRLRILITGGSGYIGFSVIRRLGGRFSFVNYDIRSDTRDDVLDLERLKEKIKRVDGVLHLAAVSRPKWGFTDPHRCLTTNVLGTLNVLEAVRQIRPRAWVILGSSREVFGNVQKFPATEKTPRVPLNAYGVSKVVGEDLLRQYAFNYGLCGISLRFCGVYTGKGDILDRVVPRFILRALEKKPLTIEGNGKERFDFVHIEDTVEGILRTMRFLSRKKGGFYDDITLARHDPISLLDLASLITRLAGSRRNLLFRAPRAYDQKGFWGSFVKAERLLGWRPKVSLEEGLRRSIQELKPLARKRGYTR